MATILRHLTQSDFVRLCTGCSLPACVTISLPACPAKQESLRRNRERVNQAALRTRAVRGILIAAAWNAMKRQIRRAMRARVLMAKVESEKVPVTCAAPATRREIAVRRGVRGYDPKIHGEV